MDKKIGKTNLRKYGVGGKKHSILSYMRILAFGLRKSLFTQIFLKFHLVVTVGSHRMYHFTNTTSTRSTGIYVVIVYTMGCPPVRGDNPRALASGLSPVQKDNHVPSKPYRPAIETPLERRFAGEPIETRDCMLAIITILSYMYHLYHCRPCHYITR